MRFEGGPARSWPCSREPPASSSRFQPSSLSPLPVIPPSPQGLPLRCLWAAPGAALAQLDTGGCPLLYCPRALRLLRCRGWHCDMGVADRAPHAQPRPPPPPSTLRRKPLGCWPRGSRCAQEAQGLSLPLVAMLWAQLLGVPDASSATWLQGQTQGCYCSLRPWQKPALQPRDLPY